ncbi:DUF2807 domain-containing protein [Mesorhizobium sp.]|uniref:GIN domain-containing protein n=1 Tax=Mesorhizobium sp. TaxID=1871066 RepID=UPI0025E11D26|nr:DUF2807 domain-containing protein [Mesorhizobium sp.]
MNKMLAWTAALSLGVAVICLSLANSLAGNDWRGNRWWHLASSCRVSGDATKPGSVTLAWEPAGSEFHIALPATVTYRPGAPSQAIVTGDPETVSHVRLSGNVLAFDDDFNCDGGLVSVQLTGPAVSSWRLSGSGKLELSDLAQETLDLRISGSGDVRASGSVRDLSLRISGSGSGDFRQLAAKTASVQISGSGNADIAAQDQADIRLSGSGNVQVHGSPKINSHVSGSGRVETVP